MKLNINSGDQNPHEDKQDMDRIVEIMNSNAGTLGSGGSTSDGGESLLESLISGSDSPQAGGTRLNLNIAPPEQPVVKKLNITLSSNKPVANVEIPKSASKPIVQNQAPQTLNLNLNPGPKAEEQEAINFRIEPEPKDLFDGLEMREAPPGIKDVMNEIVPTIDETKEVAPAKEKKSLFGVKKSSKKDKKQPVTINDTPKISGSSAIDDDGLLTKEYNKLKMKRIATTIIILLVLLSLIIFGVYNTFLKPEKSIQEITVGVNNTNMTTPFPDNGVEAFIKQNIDGLSKDLMKRIGDAENLEMPTEHIYINSVVKKTASIANVYFTARISTTKGDNDHNFMIPIDYNYKDGAYSPAGILQITPVNPKNTLKVQDNPVMSFKGVPNARDEVARPVATFVENFLMMMYNENVDITPYYKGVEILGDPNVKFSRITDFKYYNGTNKNGFNAEVEYILILNEGVEFRVKNYMKIEESGENSYVISNIV